MTPTRKTTTAADKAAAQEAAAAAVAALPDELRTMAYRDLAAAAKTEAAAKAAAKKAKKKAPATPHLDALEVRHAAGETFAGSPKPKAAGKGKPEPKPAPVLTGHRALALRSDKHADLAAAALNGTSAQVLDGWLMVPKTEAQAAADALGAAATGKPIYDARLLVASYVMVRLAFPKVTGSRRGGGDAIIDTLNTQAPGRWSVKIKLDGTLLYRVIDEAGELVVEGGARQVGAALPVAA